ncbi:hypothetical protein VitviT2T_001158 [Vitis vinifera]|uniref:Uncharacterized protein n=1 Tax=Vitis vinifera TaxID=29760 RepID=A0ABY9BF34_VITVI|nr:hypothetical protein VitviT2T_001158 [Vitis vinifera]
MSSWGIRMELLRIATHDIPHSTRVGILSCRLSTFSGYLTSGIPSADIPPSPDISHPVPDAGWERRAFQLPRSDMSGSSDSAYPESICNRQFRFPGQLGSSDTGDSPDPFPPTIKKQTLIILTTKSPFCIVQRNFS